MTFDHLIERNPNVILADLIQLFLLGYDNKIYINIYEGEELIIEDVRIIDDSLNEYYERKIQYITDDIAVHMGIHFYKEV